MCTALPPDRGYDRDKKTITPMIHARALAWIAWLTKQRRLGGYYGPGSRLKTACDRAMVSVD
jgi:hypothetical protein